MRKRVWDALPRGVERFLAESGVDLQWYRRQAAKAAEDPRFVRLSPLPAYLWNGSTLRREGHAHERARKFLRDNGGRRVEWCEDETWAVPQERTLSLHEMYRAGVMQGVDAASVKAVDVLQVRPGQRVLDLCCAPGAKLSIVADRMRRRGTLVGVDPSASRMNTCVGVARRSRLGATQHGAAEWDLRLLQTDGALFSPEQAADRTALRWSSALDAVFFAAGAPQQDDSTGPYEPSWPRSRLSPAQREAASAMSAQLGHQGPLDGFDRVLVDTQCTHEGSIRHVFKQIEMEVAQRAPQGAISRLFDAWAQNAGTTRRLQRALISRGFELLRPGGELVYSTCSFAPAQNEHVVSWLCAKEPAAKLLQLPTSAAGVAVAPVRQSGLLSGTVYMDPLTSSTSGLFLARIQKRTLWSGRPGRHGIRLAWPSARR